MLNLNNAINILQNPQHSHTIHLSGNYIGAQGANYLKMMIKFKFPPYIILETNHLRQIIENNDAIQSIRDPNSFESKIKDTFLCSMPVLQDILYENIQEIIAEYVGI